MMAGTVLCYVVCENVGVLEKPLFALYAFGCAEVLSHLDREDARY
jgi:hypothetical protein